MVVEFIVPHKIKCGESTCASEPGVFCPYVQTRSFGTKYLCGEFDQKLVDQDGWLQRCPACLKAQQEVSDGQ